MKRKIIVGAAFCMTFCSLNISVAQELTKPLMASRKSEDSWPPQWLAGAWEVTAARVLENGETSRPKFGYQDVLLFSGRFEIELYLPDAGKHRACNASGSTITAHTSGENGITYCQSEYEDEGKKKKVKFKLSPLEGDPLRAKVTFFHRRQNGVRWEYDLELRKIEDKGRISEIASSILPFLHGTAKMEVFGQRSIGQLEAEHRAFLTEWANNAINSKSPSSE